MINPVMTLVGNVALNGNVEIIGNLSVTGGTIFQVDPVNNLGNIVVITNDALPSSFIPGTFLSIVNTSNVVNTRILLDSYGIAAPLFTGRDARGNIQVLSNTLTNDILVGLVGFGYGTNSYSSSAKGRIYISAAENWSNANQGTQLNFYTTPNGSNVTIDTMRLQSRGSLAIGNILANNSANLQVKGGIFTDNIVVQGSALFQLNQTTPIPGNIIITNDGTPKTLPTGTLLTIVNDNIVGHSAITRIVLDSYGQSSSFVTGRKAQGNIQIQTATLKGNILVGISGVGYGSTEYSSVGRSRIELLTSENWTDIAQGTNIDFFVTPSGSNVTASTMRLQSNGSLAIGNIDATGNSNLQVVGGIITDTLSASGNVIVGNITVTGVIVSTKEIISGNITAGNAMVTGSVTAGPIIATSARINGAISTTGNITVGGNISVFGTVITTPGTPGSSSAPGTPGQIVVDSGNIYVCTATNTWKFASLTAF